VSSWVTHQNVHKLNLRISRKLLTSNVLSFSGHQPSRWIHAAAEVWEVGEALAILFSMLIRLCVMVVFTILLLLVSWHLTTVIVAAVTTVFLLTRQLARRADRVGVAAVRANEDFTHRLVEMLSGMRVIRAFGQERREEASFAEASARARVAGFRLDLAVNATDPLLEVLYIPMLVGTLGYALAVGVSVPTVFAFLLLLHRLQPHVRGLDSDRVRLARHAPAVREVFGLLARPDEGSPPSGPVPCPAFLDSIEFREVVYAYRGRGHASALHRVSFTIRRGQMTALVGKSGAGKSTLINLLLRFDDPSEGEILVDGVPLRQLDLGDWRRRLALAGQDAELMSGTVFENIAYGRADADPVAVLRAARDAYAHGFIAAFEAGYDTVVGARGATLSGGQRQRIGLARAFVRAPDILILDEATSSLDSLSEAQVQAALARFRRKQRTVIVITHRPSTISAADQVIVLDRGRVVQIGTPEQLLEQNGVFAELHPVRWPAPPVGAGGGAGRLRSTRHRPPPAAAEAERQRSSRGGAR
jgi:subfamily B ATP-binding cassette protein MsbA